MFCLDIGDYSEDQGWQEMNDPVTVGIIGLAIFFILLVIGVPISASMAIVGFVGFSLIISFSGALLKLAITPFQVATSYELAVIPLFILMAHICFGSGFTKDLYNLVYSWLGRFHGGLAIASIAACAIFAAISASSIATAVTLGLVALPEMRKYKYDDTLATGSIAAGGTLGSMIPPSGAFIVYGMITENSIGKLFMAGVFPGILQATLYAITIYIMCRYKPSLGPRGPKTTWKEKFTPLLSCGEIGLLIFLTLGGLFIGWFTPTEAGAVGAAGAIIISIARKRFTLQVLKDACFNTAKTTGMIYFLIIGAFLMNFFLASSTIPNLIVEYVSVLVLSKYIVMGMIIIIYLILGCFIDGLGMVLLTIPVIYPLVISLGFNPIWFGVIIVLMGEVAVTTPPVGMNVFAISGITDVPITTVYKGILPFFIANVILIAIIVAFPQISLWFPSLMK